MTNFQLVVQAVMQSHDNIANYKIFTLLKGKGSCIYDYYKWKMGQIFVAFSDYPNFKISWFVIQQTRVMQDISDQNGS